MKTDFSVYASLLSATPSDAENLASWLADREAENEAKMMEVDETVQDEKLMATVSGRYDEAIAVSQIRILSKQYTSEPDIIPYVAVIDKWDDEMWLIVPFSHYNTPATPGEMATGLTACGLHVLQAWNGRTVQDSILKNSYLVGTISDEVRNDALALFRHQMFGSKLPESFASYRGSPIVEASDPRREYLSECIERLKPLSEAVLAEAEQVTNVPGDAGVQKVEMRLVGPGLEDEEKNRIWEEYGFCDYALAAATSDVCPSVPLVAKKKSWKGNYREVSGFEGFMVGDEPRPMKFYIEDKIDDALLENGVAKVEAYKRDTRQLVGTGQIMIEDGEQVAKVKIGNIESPVSVGDASEIVLVLV